MTTGSVTNSTDPNTDVSQGPRSGLRHLNRLWGLTIADNTAKLANNPLADQMDSEEPHGGACNASIGREHWRSGQSSHPQLDHS
jgi:hypothetical protein